MCWSCRFEAVDSPMLLAEWVQAKRSAGSAMEPVLTARLILTPVGPETSTTWCSCMAIRRSRSGLVLGPV